MKFGLRGIRGLLKDVGNPHRAFSSIHIAGSNGKGSTAAMIAAILTSAGYRVGLYTSPHLMDFRERIRINGVSVSQKTVLGHLGKLRAPIEKRNVTFFEAATALAFLCFAERHVDVAVIETGLGGRLDATNVIKPLLCVITSISLEHAQILGNSLRAIAYEKAGIIKSEVPCVTGVRNSSVLQVIRKTCRLQRSSLMETGRIRCRVNTRNLKGSVVSFTVGGLRLENLRLDLPGEFQARNAVTAVAALPVLSRAGLKIRERDIRGGLRSVRRKTGLHGRLSVHGTRPRLIMDVAHNPAAILSLVGALKKIGIANVTLVFGVMADKQFRRMVQLLSTITGSAIAVQPGTNRAVRAEEIEGEFRRIGVPVRCSLSVREGLNMAKTTAGKNGTVLVTGSHFVVGEALAALEGKKYLTINQ